MSKEDKTKPIFGLDKIPDSAYIKILQEEISELKVELGKEKSYIEELEEEVKALKVINEEVDMKKRFKGLLKEKDEKILSLQNQIQKLKFKHKKDLSRIINQKITRDGQSSTDKTGNHPG